MTESHILILTWCSGLTAALAGLYLWLARSTLIRLRDLNATDAEVAAMRRAIDLLSREVSAYVPPKPSLITPELVGRRLIDVNGRLERAETILTAHLKDHLDALPIHVEGGEGSRTTDDDSTQAPE